MANKKVYLVIGSNNFWYAQCDTKSEAIQTAKAVLDGERGYADPEGGNEPETPDEVHVYHCEEVERLTLDEETNRHTSIL